MVKNTTSVRAFWLCFLVSGVAVLLQPRRLKFRIT